MNGQLDPPVLDVEGYLAGVELCLAAFPGLTILTGERLRQPHLDADRVRQAPSSSGDQPAGTSGRPE